MFNMGCNVSVPASARFPTTAPVLPVIPPTVTGAPTVPLHPTPGHQGNTVVTTATTATHALTATLHPEMENLNVKTDGSVVAIGDK